MRILRRRSLVVRGLQFLVFLISLQSTFDLLSDRPKASAAAEEAVERNESIFIASIHWNNEKILRSHWIPAVIELVKHYGPENVFVSIQESGSWDGSKGALLHLDELLEGLAVPRRIVLDNTTHSDEISRSPSESGWILTSRGRMELRRIPYLAKLRNLVLEPLPNLLMAGKRFDKILFLNDVVFNTQDVRRLIATRSGDYAAACSIDFARPPTFYDTFALRDSEGHGFLMQTWPYFRAKVSRRALKTCQPVPVQSCWNGIAVFDSEPFYDDVDPLHFRGIPDSLAAEHLEGSECCLIHADNRLTATKGIWLNPNVRVGYTAEAYDAVNPGDGKPLMSHAAVLYASWENRTKRWFTTPILREMVVLQRLGNGGSPSKEAQSLALRA